MRVPGPGGACWIDGRPVPAEHAVVSLEDPALLAGFGLFESIAVRDGRLVDLDEHLRRLADGAVRLALDLPPDSSLRAVVSEAAESLDAPAGWLKIVVTGGGRFIVLRDAMDPAEEGRETAAVLLPWRRNPHDPLAGFKTLSYAANLLGLRHARERGAQEGLWLNTRGHLAEGCTSNLFIVQGSRLFTPAPRDGILPGVVRAVTIRAAARLRLTVHEGKTRLRRLERAHEAFLTSSLRGVRPLVRVDGRAVGRGRPGGLTGRLAAEVARLRGLPAPEAAHGAALRPAGAGLDSKRPGDDL